MESPPKINHDSFTFRFPARLWRIINSCSSGAISWGSSGKTIRILRKKFEEEYLTGDAKLFKTTKYESFVRQLNHYGFKKVKKRTGAGKKLCTPILHHHHHHHRESKEETSMLSEYFNLNFVRGQPERVAFLERRSLLHENAAAAAGLRGKHKRRQASIDLDDADLSQIGAMGKKIKKESSVQVSHSSLQSGNNDGLSSPDDDSHNSGRSTGRSGKPERGRGVPTQTVTSAADGRNQTGHNTASRCQSVASKKMYHPSSEAGGKSSLRSGEGRGKYPHRPYYPHDSLEPRYLRPHPLGYPHHLPPPWQQPFRHCPPQMYDPFFGACGGQEEYYYPPYDYRPMMRVRSPDAGCYPPIPYPDGRYLPPPPPEVWEPMYDMNRRYGIPGDEYGCSMMNKQKKWYANPCDHPSSSSHGRPVDAPDPFSAWPHPQYGSVEWRDVDDFIAEPHPGYTGGEDTKPSSKRSAWHVQCTTFDHTGMSQVSSHSKACSDPSGANSADFGRSQEWPEPAGLQNMNGTEVGYQEQNEGLVASQMKNKEGCMELCENLHIVTDADGDLPLDVAEETVITCNATSDHSLPHTSSTGDTPSDSSCASASPGDSPESESFHVLAGKGRPSSSSGNLYRHQDISAYAGYLESNAS